MLRALHAGTVATLAAGSDCSESFAVTVGVKQGCVLAPVLFNVYLLAVSMLALGEERRGGPTEGSVAGLTFNSAGPTIRRRRRYRL